MPQVSPDGVISVPSETLILLGQVSAKVDTVIDGQREIRLGLGSLEGRVSSLEHWRTRAVAMATAVALAAGGLWQLLSFLWKP